ncbi:putative bifunctional diguanylate cyclase/phosphodiesterase, partial [Parasphingorhabdus sp.]|uniref:putative bifunctional diguanylate cyclase/phosphodiesterase n=1 Tax=Parasphingorhabdus sp. TaxID=2709688 RepID=UPI003C7388BA
FADEIFAQHELTESAETVKLLLNDFEEQSSNWLFSVDRGGFLLDVCDRFAEVAHRSVADLNESLLVSLLDEEEDRRMLTNYISQGVSFPAIMVAVTIDDEVHWWQISGRATKEGAGELGVAMRGVISDMTAQKSAEEKVRYMAHFDGLTDLPNRRFFTDALNRAVHRAQPEDKIALLLFDLDHFKAINDTLGHPIGDKFLTMVSRRLENIAKSNDTLARIGGDEFALLLSGERAEFAEDIANMVVNAACKPFLIDDHNVVSSASVGLAQWTKDITEPDILVKYADLALYSAKRSGRNRVAIFEKEMDVVAEQRRKLELDLRASFADQEMRLHYQPVIDLKTLKQTGFEALLRWEHPERGVVMPNDFISVAEETGMIVQLGEWVIRQALEDAAQWDEALSVAVNLSPSQMRSTNLIPTIVNALAQTGIAPERMELEITESILMQDSDVNIRTLHSLRKLGVRISLDDFGTGYSSLNYLRSFPFDKIKIDRCFVNEIDSRDDCRAIIKSVISLAKNLGMTTTAEGVERQEQVEDLRILGCDQVQGYLYGKAEALDNCTDLRPAEKWVPRVGSVSLSAAQDPSSSETRRKRA